MSQEENKNKWSESESIDFYNRLLKQAIESISEKGASMVLGPMFILRSPEENFIHFKEAQTKLQQNGIEIFDQLPILDYNLKEAPFRYDLKFEIFYKGLINSGKIKHVIYCQIGINQKAQKLKSNIARKTTYPYLNSNLIHIFQLYFI